MALMPRKAIALLKDCAKFAALDEAKELHCAIVESGLEVNALVRSTLVHSYMKCRSIENSRDVFDKFSCERDIVAWTAIITGYAQHRLGDEAFFLFNQMRTEGEIPNNFTFTSIIKACAVEINLTLGTQVHAGLVKAGLESDVCVGNALIDMYAKCQKMEHAHRVFDSMHERDVVSWSSMISGYAQLEHWSEVAHLFEAMQQKGLKPNSYTYVGILKACAGLRDIAKGRQVHCQVVERTLEMDLFVRSILVDMYVKCGDIDDARYVFHTIQEPDLVLWNTMISGYAENGLRTEALSLFAGMQQKAVKPDKVTFASILRACACLGSFFQGRQLHACILREELGLNLFLGNTLIDMYVKCRRLEDAHDIFNSMHEKDVVTWNCLLSGYTQQGCGDAVLTLFRQMLQQGEGADIVTYLTILSACGALALTDLGKQVHVHLIQSNMDSSLIIQNTLVDMYAKCGCIGDAQRVFDETKERDVVAWNTILTSYAEEGLSKEVVALFKLMQQEGAKPTAVTFTCVLSACWHACLVEDGCQFFKSFTHDYCLKPTIEHFNCLMDLFGRLGKLHEASDFLKELQGTFGVEPWLALLAASKTYSNLGVGEHAFYYVQQLDPGNVEATVLLSNLYAAFRKLYTRD